MTALLTPRSPDSTRTDGGAPPSVPQTPAPADPATLADRAEEEVRLWSAGYDPATPGWTARFPYGPVLDLVRGVGRNALSLGLREGLRAARCRMPVRTGGADADGDELMLRAWLPMTYDVGEGDYDSYIGSPVLATLHDRHRHWSSGQVLDTTALALLADLVTGECATLGDTLPDRDRERRIRAVAHALADWKVLAPQATNAPPAWLTEGRSGVPDALTDAVAVAQSLAAAVDRRTDRATAVAVHCSFMPTTPEHDELMFIRTIQVFECLYQQVERSLDTAVDAVAAGAPAAAAGELGAAITRLRACGLLYRIVTTMPRPAFAVIRGATDGRSAIQSRTFRRVEELCAHPLLARDPLVRDRLLELDEAWSAMKRTHWGIALKIIGRVRGTGGTAGADFLRERAERPLVADRAGAPA